MKYLWQGLVLFLTACSDATGPSAEPAPVSYSKADCALPNWNSGPACTRAMAAAAAATAAAGKGWATGFWTGLAGTFGASVAWWDWSQTRDANGYRGPEDDPEWNNWRPGVEQDVGDRWFLRRALP